MIAVRDIYFAAWVIALGYRHEVSQGEVRLEVTPEELGNLKRNYAENHKTYHDKVRKLVRALSQDRLKGA